MGAIFLTAVQVRQRYGGISHMCLHRWVHDPNLGFPQPTKINTRRYFDQAELEAWDAAQRTAQRDQNA